jgi:hypothetical protein
MIFIKDGNGFSLTLRNATPTGLTIKSTKSRLKLFSINYMPDPTAAERMRRYRARKAGRLPPAELFTCANCSRPHTGAHDPFCAKCWLCITEEGRADLAFRQAAFRVNRKTQS